jgi:hypothetical protein
MVRSVTEFYPKSRSNVNGYGDTFKNKQFELSILGSIDGEGFRYDIIDRGGNESPNKKEFFQVAG